MLANPLIRLALKRDAQPIAELSRDFIEHGLKWSYVRAQILRAIADPSLNVAVAREQGRLQWRRAVWSSERGRHASQGRVR